jgi:hypothetical protein
MTHIGLKYLGKIRLHVHRVFAPRIADGAADQAHSHTSRDCANVQAEIYMSEFPPSA